MRADENGKQTLTTVTSIAVGGSAVQIASGNFLPGMASTFVLVNAIDGHARFDLFQCDAALSPSRVSSLEVAAISTAAIAVAAADVDQSGTSELVVASAGAAASNGENLDVTLVSFDEEGAMSAGAPGAIGKSTGARAITAGAFAAGSYDEQVAIAWTPDGTCVNVAVCSFGGGTPSAHATYTDPGPLEFTMSIAIASGDMNLDGVDEVLVSMTACLTDSKKHQHHGSALLLLLKTGNECALTPACRGAVSGPNLTYPAAWGALVGLGNIGDDGTPAAVVTAVGYASTDAEMSGDTSAWAAIVPISPTLLFPPDCVDACGTSNTIALAPHQIAPARLALGDFSGKSVKVGAPQYYPCDIVNNVVAVLNAPPTESGINLGQATLTFTLHDSQTSAMSIGVNKTWSTSQQIGVNVGQLNASLSATYGEQFSKTEDSSTTLSESFAYSVSKDDLIILSGTHYDVWEYPVYQGGTSEPQGHLLVVFPNVVTVSTDSYDGAGGNIDYFPDHQVGVLMSYQAESPRDASTDTMLGSQTSFDVGSSAITVTVDQTSSSGTHTQNHVSTSLSLNGGYSFSPTLNFISGTSVGVHEHVSESYGLTSTQSLTYMSSTSVSIYFEAITTDATARYRVEPYVYYSTDGGFLVVDYSVTMNDDGYWATKYQGPSADINHPYSSTLGDPHRTTSLTFVNQSDGSVEITARIGNYSFTTAYQVKVEIFAGYPGAPTSVAIGEPQIISNIPPRERRQVSATWWPPSSDAVQLWLRVSSTDPEGAFTTKLGYCPWPATTKLVQAQPDA